MIGMIVSGVAGLLWDPWVEGLVKVQWWLTVEQSVVRLEVQTPGLRPNHVGKPVRS